MCVCFIFVGYMKRRKCAWTVWIQWCIQSTSLHFATASGGDAGARTAVCLGVSFQPQSLQPDPHPEQTLTTVDARRGAGSC